MWTWEEINSEWLTTARYPGLPAELPNQVILGHSPEEVVAAFDRVERILGRGCIDEVGGKGRLAPGALHVFATGRLLEVLDGVVGGQSLVEKLRKGEAAARCEAEALYLIRSRHPECEAEYEHKVAVDARETVPDLRVRVGESDPWTYIEVARPAPSQEQRRLWALGERLAASALKSQRPAAIEVALDRLPTEAETIDLEKHLRLASETADDVEETLSDGLGRFVASSDPETGSQRLVPAGPSAVVGAATLGRGPDHRSTITVAFPTTERRIFFDGKLTSCPRIHLA
jgi:hypothetical protein